MARQPRLFTIGYQGLSQAEFINSLIEAKVSLVVDVRESPNSRHPGFRMMRLFEALRKAGIEYRHEPGLGNPANIRALFKAGRLEDGRAAYRELLDNGRADKLGNLLAACEHQPTAIMCLERDVRTCHRGVIAEAVDEAAAVRIVHL